MSVVEGADIGALFSLYVAAFVIYQAWVAGGPRARSLVAGVGRLALVVVCAACLAAQAIAGLLATEIEGVAGAQQDTKTKEQRWDWATQWSLPKWETLSLAVPGLFGYRMDTPNGGNYWGAMGRDSAWDRFSKMAAKASRRVDCCGSRAAVLMSGCRSCCWRFGPPCNPCVERTLFSACLSASCSGSGWA